MNIRDDYEYRIEYTIQRGKVSEDTGFADEFEDIGFGSSGGWQDVDAALHAAGSDIQNRSWETEPGMPGPEEVDA